MMYLAGREGYEVERCRYAETSSSCYMGAGHIGGGVCKKLSSCLFNSSATKGGSGKLSGCCAPPLR